MKFKLPRAAYVHVPFCDLRCPYCNFTVSTQRDSLIGRYLAALEKELSQLEQPRWMDTLFIGGGTPTFLNSVDLERLLKLLKAWLPGEPDLEWTIEANPNDLSDEKCQLLREAGVNRISLGGQSFQPEKLAALGRNHDVASLETALACSLKYFPAVSVDLIFGVPGETEELWLDDLTQVIASGVHHVSTYGLTFEKGSRFWGQRESGRLQPCPEEVELELYLMAIDWLKAAGFEHYEISNFAKPSFPCRHNQTYWDCQPWYAFGPGAASFVDGVRHINHRSTTKYLERLEQNQSPIAESETIDQAQWTAERFVFGMRRMKGVDFEELAIDADPSTLERIRGLASRDHEDGWLEKAGDRWRLSLTGLAISDSLWPKYFA
jgi:oxygen-independent coproporphyrinogen III oxidase